METSTTIYFVRHGLVYNQSDVYYGRLLGFPLSDEGRYQASRTREHLKNEMIAAIYSSPQLRARETAQIISEPHKRIIVTVSELLDEVYSPYDGSPKKEIEKINWNVYSHGKPGFEQPANVLARVQQFVRAIRLGHLGQQVVAVTHGDLIAFLILWVKGSALTTENKQSLYKESLKPCSITTLSFQTRKDNEVPGIEHVYPSIERITIESAG